ncbi:unnamed protein product [Oppiella nova]|uniref:BHLH domain-containing protein n=1 Tax=Oppiella nova TaxID=334625 RepID=A0A7R9QC34_9ACAR|nr:unnamed protein product [Oppiella nova]CAG2162755.1 unnamed protein product [Oppiella nova]
MCDSVVGISSHMSSPAKDVSASLAAISSLVTSLLPDQSLQAPQLDLLITRLIHLQSIAHYNNTNSTGGAGMSGADTSVQTCADESDVRRERHRRNERVRHHKIIELIRELSQMIGLNGQQETHANVLQKSARYVLFLSYVMDKLEVDSTDDTVDIMSEQWLQSLHPLYLRAVEEATYLIQNAANDSCGSTTGADLWDQSFDQCLPLKS